MACKNSLSPGTLIFAISFKLLAIEYLFGKRLADLLDQVVKLPADLWGFHQEDLADFDAFCVKAGNKLAEMFAQVKLDPRKQKLFSLIYSSKGDTSVKALADNSCWSSRQINRYFNGHFGTSLKSYCNILRFRASFTQIKEGKFFHEGNFADQSHFIKKIKRFSGVVPKELTKNKNDRFIQFSLLPHK